MVTQTQRLVGATEAARLAGVTVALVHWAAKRGLLAFVATPLGKAFDPDDVARWRREAAAKRRRRRDG